MTVELEDLKNLVVTTLRAQDSAGELGAETPLIHYLPELDSFGALGIVEALEQHFGITIEHEDLTADVFGTLGSLAALVESKLQ